MDKSTFILEASVRDLKIFSFENIKLFISEEHTFIFGISAKALKIFTIIIRILKLQNPVDIQMFPNREIKYFIHMMTTFSISNIYSFSMFSLHK